MTMRAYLEKNGQKVGEYLYGGYLRCDVYAEGGYLHYLPKGRGEELTSKPDNPLDRERLINLRAGQPVRIIVEQMRDMLDALCHDGLGHLPLSNAMYDEGASVLSPTVVHVADTEGGKRYFTTNDVEKGAPESHGLPVPPPTFVLIR
jgi:hypothetical protein